MHLSPLVALIGWIAVGVYLFGRYPVRTVLLVNFFGGWAILPGARYTPTTEIFPYWILGVCLPSNYFFTKALVTGLTGLVGIVLFHFTDLKKIRPSWCDIPMAAWCCAPLLSALTHWNTLHDGLLDSAYLALCWGAPWLAGRIYFSDHDSQLLATKACVIGALCYVPICLVEICAGPQLYAFVYGYEPYRWIGAERYVGFRPIGLLEDGNQLGIWMAAASLVAICLAVRRLATRILGLPMIWVAAGLTLTTLLCQSAGSILLLVLLLPLTLMKRRFAQRALIAILIFGIASFALFRMTHLVSLRSLAQENRTAHSISAALTSMGRQSFGWRLAREESEMTAALRKPLLGYGQWNWWQGGDQRPWSLWLLALGMYGLVGLTAFGLILFLPVLRAVWSSASGRGSDDIRLRQALVGVILMLAFDNLLNGAMILPYLLLMGGLIA
jgi:type IV secretory pathway VirB3-like protein